ncbi:hypothetical protein ACEG18_09580 [Collinsella aerofaciens]|uniref:hypothetical protein n=1 Tax=Collinsella aerofaciens TaxID=74426 RepID=UPI00355B1C88
MTNDERRLHRKHLVTAAVAVVTSIVLLGLLYTVVTHRCLDKTLRFGREAMVFLQAACEKYDRYEQGRKTEATHNLDAAVESFSTFLPPDRVEVNDDRVEEYVHTEHLSGMLVMDADGHMAAHYDIDGRDPLMLWREELACSSVVSMYRGSKVSYSTVVERRDVDFAVSAVPYGDGVALGYRSLAPEPADDYSYTIADVLVNNTFHQSPTVLVMRDAQIVSSNDSTVDITLARLLVDSGIDWKDEGLTRVEYRGGLPGMPCVRRIRTTACLRYIPNLRSCLAGSHLSLLASW